MDFLNALRIASEVARQGGFSGAGRETGLSPASISRIIGDLEDDLGARLFNRTTRKLSLTAAGEALLRRGRPLLEDADALRNEIRDHGSRLHGTLRISTVNSFGSIMLAPALPDFSARHPELRISLDISNRFVDLVEENVDVAIRVGPLASNTLIARKIFTQRMVFVASPGYLAEHGMPECLQDLQEHRSVTQISGAWGRMHRFFRRDGSVIEFAVPQDFVVSAPDALRHAVLAGSGYGLASDFSVATELEAGRLVRLLPELVSEETPVFAVYPDKRYLPARVRAFLDFLSERFAPDGIGPTAQNLA